MNVNLTAPPGRDGAERELARRVQELLESHRRKDEFLAVLAHELRGPLAPIRNAVEVLRAGPADPSAVAWGAGVIERQVASLACLVDDLLDVARIASGKLRVECEPLDLAVLVRAAVEDRRGGPEASGVALALAVPDAAVWVNGDRARLTQVVGNLLANALKFTDPGGRVAVRLEVPGETAWAAVTVADTGIGIAAEVLPRVFDTFAQDERGAGRSRGGLGLGLALVKGLVELHGGGVAARSDGPGRGTEIHFWLPLAESGPGPAAPAATPPAVGRRRVLVVDDDPDCADTLCVLLDRMGHETTAAYSGPAALDAVRRCRPDMVLCDLDLPGMDGCEVARSLRADPLTARLRLIAVSGYGQEEDRRQSLRAGFDSHLTKPVDPEDWERILAETPKADH